MTRKLGRKPPSNRPALRLADVLTGTIPEHPAAVDHLGSATFGLYKNDSIGDCGPASAANLVRLVSLGLTGTMVAPSTDDVIDLYSRVSGYNPATGANDDGVEMQAMLDELLRNGVGNAQGGTVKPVAFAKVDVSSDDELEAAVSIFGGVLWGVDLHVAQDKQTDTGTWDYVKGSPDWGGHAIVDGQYAQDRQTVITWGLHVATTDAFRRHQLEEAWVVIWPWNLDHPAFQQGIDLQALAAAYKALTGRDLPLPEPTPTPQPQPAPASDPVAAFLATPVNRAGDETVLQWARDHRHSNVTREVARAIIRLADSTA